MSHRLLASVSVLARVIAFVWLAPMAIAGQAQSAEERPVFVTTWGSGAEGRGQLESPAGIAVDAAGRVYVAEEDADRITVFDSEGRFLVRWGTGGSTPGQLDDPRGLAVDESDRVYVVDDGNDRIQVFDGQGNFLRQWGSRGSGAGHFDSPRDVAVDHRGRVYVSDRDNHRVQVFDSAGTFVAEWGSRGSGPGEFVEPYGLAVDTRGHIYVVDSGNHRIQRFDTAGRFLVGWGSRGRGQGELESPRGIAVDRLGNIYVTDAGNSRIQKFDADGHVLTQWGSRGIGAGQFARPTAVEAGDDGHVYVVDGSRPRRPDAGAHAERGIDRVQKFDADGRFVTQWGAAEHLPGRLTRPRGVASDRLGHVYVADTDNFRIQKFDQDGHFLLQWGALGVEEAMFYRPRQLAVDAAGHVYVVDAGVAVGGTGVHRIQKFGPGGNLLTSWGSEGSGDGELLYPRDVSVGPAGFIYVADTGNHRIQKFDSSGHFVAVIGGAGSAPGRFLHPQGVAVDRVGNIYVADTELHRIQKLDQEGRVLGTWGSRGDGPGQFYWPHDVVVDAEGGVYVADTGSLTTGRGNHRIQKFDPDGNYLMHWGSSGSGDGQFRFPAAVAVASGGRIYVADTQNHRIQKFVLSGARGADPADAEPSPAVQSSDWPQLGGPNRDFTSAATGLAERWPPEGPAVLWRRELGEGYSTIVTKGAALYTMYRADDQEIVVAIDSGTGTTLWEFAYEAPTSGMATTFGPGPHATPLVVGDRVFSVGVKGMLHALDRSDGSLVWSRDLYEEFDGTVLEYGYSSSPIAYGDTVMVQVGGEEHAVMAFRQADGAVVWRGGDFINSHASPILIEVDGQDQLVAFMAAEVAGFDPASGRLLWSHPHPTVTTVNVSTPVWGADGILFVSSAYDAGSRALRLTRPGGETAVDELWFSRRLRVHFGTAIRIGDRVYGSSGDRSPAFLSAVDIHSGELLWRDRTFSQCSYVYADDKLIVLDDDGELALVSILPHGIEVRSRASIFDSLSRSVPTLVGTTLYVRNRREIVALELGEAR